MKTKLSDFVFEFLAGKGVRQVFMLPGGGVMHLNDSLGRRSDMAYTCFAHEQALAVAAESFAQFTNFPGVALVTSGPGGTNCVTAVAAAYIDSTPCVFLSGQAKRSDLKGVSGVRQLGPQEVDIVGIVSPVTKYAVTVLDPAQIRFHLERAWHEATSGRMGPVWLDIPLDVQAAMIDGSGLAGFSPGPESRKASGAELHGSLSRVIALLSAAERPLILAGNGVKLSGAEQALCRFAEENQIPTLLTWKAIDYLAYDHPLNFGSPGVMGQRPANFLVQNCDLLLVLGCRLDSSITAFNLANFAPYAKKVMVDIDGAEIRKLPSLDVPIEADAGEFFRALCERQREIKIGQRARWHAYARRLKEKYPIVQEEHRKVAGSVSQYVFTEELFAQLSADDVITPESSGAAGEVTFQALRVKKGQKIRNAAGLGAMGFGLPYAIGGCLACDRRRTILINGDGAFQLNIQELETVVRLKLPIKMFILENNGYASIRATQDNLFGGFHVGSDPASGFSVPDISALAAAFGIRCEQATDHGDMAAAIARTLEGKDPVLCRVKISDTQVTAPRVKSMKTPEGGMVSMPLERMWPYLPEEEIAENMIARKAPE